MDRLNKKRVKLWLLSFLCVCLGIVVIKSKAEFLILNSYILMIFAALVILDIYEIVTIFVFRGKINKLNSIKPIISIILSIFVAFSFLFYNVDKITNDNSNDYIDQYLNMNDFIGESKIIINTSGESYRTLFTRKYFSYMTGSNYEKTLPVVGIQNEYIEFKKDFLSKFLFKKYFEDKISEHEYIEENGFYFCEENVLTETQLYIVIKGNNSVDLVKIYTNNNYEKDKIIKTISDKTNLYITS